MTAAQYRRAYDRLYVASMRANDQAEVDRIHAKLMKLNTDYAKTAVRTVKR
jgi:hypothetical protein